MAWLKEHPCARCPLRQFLVETVYSPIGLGLVKGGVDVLDTLVLQVRGEVHRDELRAVIHCNSLWKAPTEEQRVQKVHNDLSDD